MKKILLLTILLLIQILALKKVKKAKNVKRLSMNVAGLKPGVYFIEIADGSYTERQKLIIQQ